MIAEPVEMTEVEVIRHRFTVAEYMRMVEVGLLSEDSRVELIRGEIIETGAISISHAATIRRLIALLSQAFGEQVILSVYNPVWLDDESLPQADIAALIFIDNFYGDRHPGPDDVLLLIEVADSSLSYDRRVKSSLYGAAGIAEYWIVNLPERQIEVYRESRPNGYRAITIYTSGETVSPLAFPDVVVNVDDILGANA